MELKERISWSCVAIALALGIFLVAHKSSTESKQSTSTPSTSLAAQVQGFSLAKAPKTTNAIVWKTPNGFHSQLFQAKQAVSQPKPANVASPALSTSLRPIQEIALAKLLQSRGESVQVYLREQRETPIQIKGDLFDALNDRNLTQEQNRQRTAEAFLHANRDLLLLEDIEKELTSAKTLTADDGRTTIRFTQFYHGLEVWPCEVGVHLNPQGGVELFDGAYVPTPSHIDITPTISAEQAATKATSMVPGGSSGTLSQAKLLIYAPLDGDSHLGWKFNLTIGLLHDWELIVDAKDGKGIYAVNHCVCSSASGSGVDQLNTNRTLNLALTNGTYYLIDQSKPMFIASTGEGYIEIINANGLDENHYENGPLFYVTSSNPNAWSLPSAVSASFNLSQTYDYYLSRHGRSSFDGNGSSFQAIVNVANLQNAYWNGSQHRMVFGNSDKYAAALDVIGHEFTHGVCGTAVSSGGLQYTNQSGALNEALADIFGNMVEARTEGSTDWLVGTKLQTVGRNMKNPSAMMIGNTGRPYPSKMSEFISPSDSFLNQFDRRDGGGVHLNSGIINRAYYLLAEGLTGSLGIDQSEAIFYRSLTTHLSPQSQFIDARLGCIAAAESLFGTNSYQAYKTAEAFDAVEITAKPVTAPKAVIIRPSNSAPDSDVFLYRDTSTGRYNLARRETAQLDGSSGTIILLNIDKSKLSVTADGSLVSFVGSDHSFGLVNTATLSFSTIWSGSVHSATLSQDGKYGAFVFRDVSGNPTSQIYVINLQNGLYTTIDLVTPTAEGESIPNILYADSMDFSPDGSFLIYDALSTVKQANGQNKLAWSIFAVELATSAQYTLVPPIVGLNIGNPSFANTTDRYFTFEAQNTITQNSVVFVLDTETGNLTTVGGTSARIAYPSFSGDDGAVIYSDYDSTAMPLSLTSVYRQGLAADRITASGSRTLYQKYADLAAIYRRGTLIQLNQAPTVTITSPASNTTLTTPASLTISVAASDADSGISKVELYQGSTLVGTKTQFPYNFGFSGVMAGNYRFYARAYDTNGASTLSTVVPVMVVPPNASGVISSNSGQGRFEARLNTPATGSFRIEYSTNLVDWISLGTRETINQQLNFTHNLSTNEVRRFYRAVKLP
jgi:bacillolysin